MDAVMPIPKGIEYVDVTPDLAANWLEHRNLDAQRKKNPAKARKYAQTMREGRWRTISQGLAFDTDGFLQDGQHRLMAVEMSGVTCRFLIVPDQDPGNFAVLDTGYTRRPSQMIKKKNAAVLASAARIIYIVTGPDPSILGSSRQAYINLENDVVIKAEQAWPELERYAPQIIACNVAAHISKPAHLAVIAQAARTTHRGQVAEWLRGVESGAGLEADDPRLLLRGRFIRNPKLVNERVESYGLVVKAWNAFAADQPMGSLRFGETEAIPPLLP